MFSSQLNPVLLTLVWTKDDLEKALEEAGVAATEENVSAFIEQGGFEELKERLDENGWDILDRIISKQRELGVFKDSGES